MNIKRQCLFAMEKIFFFFLLVYLHGYTLLLGKRDLIKTKYLQKVNKL